MSAGQNDLSVHTLLKKIISATNLSYRTLEHHPSTGAVYGSSASTDATTDDGIGANGQCAPISIIR